MENSILENKFTASEYYNYLNNHINFTKLTNTGISNDLEKKLLETGEKIDIKIIKKVEEKK